jgi:hypothetical protein
MFNFKKLKIHDMMIVGGTNAKNDVEHKKGIQSTTLFFCLTLTGKAWISDLLLLSIITSAMIL